MQNRELFRWTFAASGLWLILSPFLLLGGQSALSNDVVGDAGFLMILGLLALITASYRFSKHDLMRTYLGFALGLVLVAALWFVEFTEAIATWNAGIVGTVLALVALYEAYQHISGHSAV
jgi:DMSO reductase anchor subunit